MFTQTLKGGARETENSINFPISNWLVGKLTRFIDRFSQEVYSKKKFDYFN